MMGDSDNTRSYFKKLAKMVHPDKNGHTLAKTSFQKLQEASKAATLSFSNGSGKPMSAYEHWFRQEEARNTYNLYNGTHTATV